MSRELERGAVRFESVTKEYVLGRPRAHLAAAAPFGNGLGRGERLQALDDVSFSIEPGDAFALIGANGAGKSTALKCLGGVTRPTSGAVRRGGRIVPLIELGIGFHPDLTGLENARFAATVAGLRGRDVHAAVDAAVAFAEIDGFLETPVKRYSSGMFARLSFGIAASLPADILLVDEILAVGDVAFQRKCYAHLAQLRRAGTTLVFVSHNDWVLKETCERGVLLAHGAVVDVAPIDSLLVTYHGIVDAAGLARGGGGPASLVDLRRVEVFGPDGRDLALHEPFRLEIDVTVDPRAERPVVGVLFADREKRILWASYSDEQGVTLSGSVRLCIDAADLPVLPGPALIQVIAFERGSPAIDGARMLEVTVSGTAPEATWERGFVHVPTQWRVEQAPVVAPAGLRDGRA